MGKFFCCVYKHSQLNCPYPSPSRKFVVSPRLLLISQNDSTDDCGVTIISHKKALHVSNLTPTLQVDTDRNDYDNTYSVATPRKNIHTTLEIAIITTTTTPVKDIVDSLLCQMSSSTSTTSLKLPPYVK